MLRLIWLTSFVLAAASIGVMMSLIVRRVVQEVAGKRRERDRAALLDQIMGWLDRRITDQAIAAKLARHRRIAGGLLIELLELVRGEDQRRLAELATRCGVPSRLRLSLTSGRRSERLEAAESLGWFRSPENREALMAALSDGNDDVALAAAATLAEWEEELPVERILVSRRGRSEASSRRLEAVLVRVAPRQVDALMRLAADPHQPERVRAAAIDAVALTGLFRVTGSLSALVSDPSAAVRAAVARGFGILAHPGGGGAVLRLLDDPDWGVRAEAAEATGRIGLTSLIGRLAGLLKDENWWVRFRAGEALVALGPEGVEALRLASSSSHDTARRTAGLILAERGLA